MIGRVVVDLAVFGLFALLLVVVVCVVLVGWQEHTNRRPPAPWIAEWNARADQVRAADLRPLVEPRDEARAAQPAPSAGAVPEALDGAA